MIVYILKDEKSKQIIQVCDNENNATVLKSNLLKTGEYKYLTIESMEVDTDLVDPLHVVKISGNLTQTGVNLKIGAINPSASVADFLTFSVGSINYDVTFNGVVNLTASEETDTDVVALTARVKDWVQAEYKSRLENDNPVI